MKNTIAVIEITDSIIRLTVGFVVDDRPVVVYKNEKAIHGLVSRGEITDFVGLSQAVASLCKYDDPNAKLNVSVPEATIILPPCGFQIFSCDKTTNVVSQTSIIEDIDIRNVISLVRKEQAPMGSEIVDIIPDKFIIEPNKQFSVPPIGEKSNVLAVHSKVYTLPARIVESYNEVIKAAHVRPKRLLVSPYCDVEYIKSLKDMPKSYMLVDMNDGFTSLTLVGNHSTYCSGHFLSGYNDLILKVSTELNVDETKAVELLETYGLCERDLSFSPVIVSSVDDIGRENKYVQADLNKIIKDFFKDYLSQFEAAYAALLTGYSEAVRKIPFVFIGKLCNLSGIEKIIKDKFPNVDNLFLSSDVIGTRGPEYVTSIGALIISSLYKGSLSDQRAKVSQLGRVEQKQAK